MATTKDDLIIQRIDDLKEHTIHRLDNIDVNLAEHMRRTNVLEKLHMDNQTRIETLEQPITVLLYLKKAAIYIAAISGAILSIAKLTDYL